MILNLKYLIAIVVLIRITINNGDVTQNAFDNIYRTIEDEELTELSMTELSVTDTEIDEFNNLIFNEDIKQGTSTKDNKGDVIRITEKIEIDAPQQVSNLNSDNNFIQRNNVLDVKSDGNFVDVNDNTDMTTENIIKPIEKVEVTFNKKPEEKKPEEDKTDQITNVLERQYQIYFYMSMFLMINSLYLLVYGFKSIRNSLKASSFILAYYTLIVLCSQISFIETDNKLYDILLVGASISLGILLMFVGISSNAIGYVVIGSSIGTLACAIYSQFFIDFATDPQQVNILAINIIASVASVLIIKINIQNGIIIAFSLIGAISFTHNFGIILNDFESFEKREKLPIKAYDDTFIYLLTCAIILLAGITLQLFLRYKILKKISDSKMEELRNASLL